MQQLVAILVRRISIEEMNQLLLSMQIPKSCVGLIQIAHNLRALHPYCSFLDPGPSTLQLKIIEMLDY